MLFTLPTHMRCMCLGAEGREAHLLGGGGGMSMRAVWVPVPPTLGPNLACPFWDLTLHSLFLLCLQTCLSAMDAIARGGYPCAASAMDALGGRGAAHVPCTFMLPFSPF
jgi:hypothetical protein